MKSEHLGYTREAGKLERAYSVLLRQLTCTSLESMPTPTRLRQAANSSRFPGINDRCDIVWLLA